MTRLDVFTLLGPTGRVLIVAGACVILAGFPRTGAVLVLDGAACITVWGMYFWGIKVITRLIPRNYRGLAWFGLIVCAIGMLGSAYVLVFDISDLLMQVAITGTGLFGLCLWMASLRLSQRKEAREK